MAVVVVALILAGGYAVLSSTTAAGAREGFRSRLAPGVTLAELSALEHLDEGRALLRSRTGLERGLAHLERACTLLPGLQQALELLAAGLESQVAVDLERMHLGRALSRLRLGRELLGPDALRDREAEVLDHIAHGLRLESPSAGSVLPHAEVTLEGHVHVPGSEPLLAIAGERVPLAGGRFRHRLHLGSGRVTVPFALEFPLEEVVAEVPVAFVIDTRAPELTVLEPVDGAVVAPRCSLRGTVVDDTVTAVELLGRSVPCADGRWSADVVLDDGPQVIEVRTRDAAGRSASASLRVEVDGEAPRVESPSGRFTVVGRGALTDCVLHVSDPHLVAVTLDGVRQQVDEQGRVQLTLTSTGPSRSFAFEAIDAAGNRTSRELRLVRDDAPPEVTLGPDGNVFPGAQAVITGTLADASPCRVEVAGDTIALEPGPFELTVPIPADARPGEALPFPLRFRDTLGNEAPWIDHRLVVLPACPRCAPEDGRRGDCLPCEGLGVRERDCGCEEGWRHEGCDDCRTTGRALCRHCGGDGAVDRGCGRCAGEGRLECGACGGSGDRRVTCPRCKGKGRWTPPFSLIPQDCPTQVRRDCGSCQGGRTDCGRCRDGRRSTGCEACDEGFTEGVCETCDGDGALAVACARPDCDAGVQRPECAHCEGSGTCRACHGSGVDPG